MKDCPTHDSEISNKLEIYFKAYASLSNLLRIKPVGLKAIQP